MPVVAASIKAKIIQYALIALIAGFFVIPLVTFCFLECKPFLSSKIASILVLFFR